MQVIGTQGVVGVPGGDSFPGGPGIQKALYLGD